MSSTFRQVFRLLRRVGVSPFMLTVPIFLSVTAAVFEGASMGLLIPILTGFLQKNFGFIKDAPYIGALIMRLPESVLRDDRMLFGVLLAGFIGAFILKNLLRFSTVTSVAYFSERSLHHLRKTIFKRYLSFGKLFFDRTNVGHHTTLLQDFAAKAIRPAQTIDKLMNPLFSLTAYLAVMVTISWRLTLVALPLFVILHFTIQFLIVGIKKLSYTIADRGSALGKKSVEILSTIPLVKASRMESEEQRRYAVISDEKAAMDFRARTLQEMILPIQEIITICVMTGIFVGALILFGRDQVASAPALMVYFYVVMNASSKFGTLSGFRGTLASAIGPLKEVTRIFDDTDKFFVVGGTKEFQGLNNSITCAALSFSYDADRKVLEDVSFTIPKGKMTAIVGPTGAGKSTLINLFMRYYDCPAGSILVDGEDIRSFALTSYLQHVGLVSQETLLLHDSLRNNIIYGLEHVSEQDLTNAVESARLADYIRKLPQGLETLVGDRGVKLSGGEKQRVSIARALLKGAEILILDEATSSLDSQTEKLIQEAIDEAITGRTAIVIAHRLSTIKHADKIVVIKDGRKAEEGTLQQLLDQKEVFFRLWEEQRF